MVDLPEAVLATAACDKYVAAAHQPGVKQPRVTEVDVLLTLRVGVGPISGPIPETARETTRTGLMSGSWKVAVGSAETSSHSIDGCFASYFLTPRSASLAAVRAGAGFDAVAAVGVAEGAC